MMNDYSKLQEQCINFMHQKNISTIYINKWNDFELGEDIDMDDYESIENLIIEEIMQGGQTSFYLKDDIDIKLIIKKELYKVLNTDSNEYSKERIIITEITEKLIPIISASLASKLGMDVAIITGVVSIVICGVFKFGKNVWCNYCKEEFEEKENIEK